LKVVINKGIKENQIEKYKALYETIGVIEDSKDAIRNYKKRALKSINKLSNKSEVEIFYWLADSLIKRNK
jgi:geranylgeranyl pyrophosphate synthase